MRGVRKAGGTREADAEPFRQPFRRQVEFFASGAVSPGQVENAERTRPDRRRGEPGGRHAERVHSDEQTGRSGQR